MSKSILPVSRPLCRTMKMKPSYFFSRRTLIYLRNLITSLSKNLKSLLGLAMAQPTGTPPLGLPPFDPSQPSVPVSYPIKTLRDLASRSYFDSFHFPFNKSSVPLPCPASGSLPNRPRLLVCHDMEGGYGDDKWVQGGTNPEAYAIWHWHLIDVFVYFSHYLVTLPPPGWTNAAHRQGVKVLGTFITEWDEGKAICDTLLATTESAQMYAKRLAELAVALGFDGWLINMENDLDMGRIPNLKEFVNHLTQTMHSLVPGSLVIWYDSVTIHGALKWQDQLNEKNKPFFDICDGIFVNYTWKSNYPELSAAEAGDRNFDVYMGIDVFGRNTFGGGQWNANVALDVLKKNNVSAAIFGPGWVYETKQPPDFETAQNCWWNLVEKSWGKRNNLPMELPFYSSFDRGRGYHISVEGGEVSNIPWNNMSLQGSQPLLEIIEGPTPDSVQVLVGSKGSSYNGGGSLTFKGNLEDHAHFRTKLFEGELLLGNLPLQLIYSVKSVGDSLLGLCLQFSYNMDKRTSVCIASGNMNTLSDKFSEVVIARKIKMQETAAGWILYAAIIPGKGQILKEVHAICCRSTHGHGDLRSKNEEGSQDNALACNHGDYYAVLGHIAISNPRENSSFPPSSSWLIDCQYIKRFSVSNGYSTISLKIAWNLDNNSCADSFPKYNVYVEKITDQVNGCRGGSQEGTREYIGVAHCQAFYVSDLAIPPATASLKFVIQVCGVDGTCQKLEDSPYYLLDIEGLLN